MTMQEFVKGICTTFATDPSSPSLVISWLEDKGVWYCSIVRYAERYGAGKYAVTNVTGEDLPSALSQLVVEWGRMNGVINV